MQIYQTVEKKKLAESLTNLRRDARSVNDIANWVVENLPAFGMNSVAHPDDATITTGINIFRSFPSESDNPEATLRLTIATRDSTERHPVVDSMFAVDGSASSSHVQELSFTLSFKDWPLLTAMLMIETLNNFDKDAITAHAVDIDKTLYTYVAYHFSGMDWTQLKALSDSDLLPKNKYNLFGDELVDYLFSMRGHVVQYNNPLPDTLSP